jgi:acyl-CoA dehydrogenase
MNAPAEGVDAIIEASCLRLFKRHGALHERSGARAESAAAGYDVAGWHELEETGLTLAMLDEDQGGAGMSHAFDIARLAGAHALPFPLCETMAANWLLSAAGVDLPAGALTLAEQPLRVHEDSGGWRVSGEARAVPWARACGVVALAMDEAECYLVHCSRGQFGVTPAVNIAEEPRDLCRFDFVAAPDRIAAVPPHLGPQPVLMLGAALRTAQIAGAARTALNMAVEYAQERRQFGRAIGAFQAIQQMMAVMATHAAAASAAGDLAVEGAVNGLHARAIAAAKIRAGEAAGKVASAAHQVLGAIGFTREHPLHTLTHRLWSWRDDFGDESAWSLTLGRHFLASGAAALWSELTTI